MSSKITTAGIKLVGNMNSPADLGEADFGIRDHCHKKFKGRVLVIDDQITGRKILAKLFQNLDENLSVTCYSNAFDALEYVKKITPDLILTDYKMPEMDGVEFTKRLRRIKSCVDVPLVVITACDDTNIRYKALDAGATDFLTRPIDQYECQARCRNLLTLRKQQQIIKTRAGWLEEQVAVATYQIQTREEETLMRLAKAGEYRDESTGLHVMRMAKISRLIAEEMGLSEAFCHEIEVAAPMHDIGKIGVPDNILLKLGELSEAEFEIMKTHAEIGYEILKGSPSKYMQQGAVIALNHHERFDGTGYPAGLKGEEIPLIARIVAVADVFDALVSQRPYKDAWSFQLALEYLQDQAGKHLDPNCVQAFIKRQDEIIEIQQSMQNRPVLNSIDAMN